MDKKNNPSTCSRDHEAMSGYWAMTATMLDGVQAMRAAGQMYLPKYEYEAQKNYDTRLKQATFTNIYKDILAKLSAKPFTKEVALDDGTSDAAKDIALNIDGQGSNLNTFSYNAFFNGINDSLTWIFVDKKSMPEGATLADEKAEGARPYWLNILARDMIAVRTAVIDGEEQFIHCRFRENSVVVDGYEEVVKERIREINRIVGLTDNQGAKQPDQVLWQLWEKVPSPTGREAEWIVVDTGTISIGVIALVPFITGRRKGTSWQFYPPLRDCADMQIKHYNCESNLNTIQAQTCFPMLQGKGMARPVDQAGKEIDLPVGPHCMLYTGTPAPGGSTPEFAYLEPNANTVTILSGELDKLEKNLRELGNQPLTANSNNLTVVTTAFAAQNGNSAVQAWALLLQGSLERAFKYTGMYLQDQSEPEVVVHTDFGIEIEQAEASKTLLEMWKGKAISTSQMRAEAKRRGFLMADYDEEEDKKKILDELQDSADHMDIMGAFGGGNDNEDEDIDPATGKPKQPAFGAA